VRGSGCSGVPTRASGTRRGAGSRERMSDMDCIRHPVC
jgi:hypothetical protein